MFKGLVSARVKIEFTYYIMVAGVDHYFCLVGNKCLVYSVQ